MKQKSPALPTKAELHELPAQLAGLQEIAAFTLLPATAKGQIVISAPHGGLHYPCDLYDFDKERLRRFRSLEDSGTSLIAEALYKPMRPVITAPLARGVLDLNRPAYALDPKLYQEAIAQLPASDPYAPYIAAGYGVIPRLSAAREPLHNHRLMRADTDRLIAAYHLPYHDKLAALLQENGPSALLIDIHSMPDMAAGKPMPDIIFGDDFGTSLAPHYRPVIDAFMRETPYQFGWNHPYAGGYITRHFGGHHSPHSALQIEINRRLYKGANNRISQIAISRISAMLDALISHIEQQDTQMLAAQ